MLDVEQLLHSNGIFPKSKKKGRYYLTCPKCSAGRKRHNQKKHCLSLMIEDERAYWKCHHCGWSGPEKGSVESFSESTRYEYPGGNYKVRKPGGFVWEHEDTDGTVHTGANGLGPALYRLEEAREAGGLIAVVEGEKDAETLWRFGIPAVTSPHGAAKVGQVPKWTPEHSAQLKGLDIVVLNDNDEPGYAHAKAVVDNSLGVAKSVRRLDLAQHWPGMPSSADVSDFIAERANYDDFDATLRELLQNAPLVKRKPSLESHTMATLETETFTPLQWIVPNYIPEGLTLLAGKPKVGKSWLALAIALGRGQGTTVLGEVCPQGDVLYCALEDNKRRMKDRTTLMIGAQFWPDNVHIAYTLKDLDHGCTDQLLEWINANTSVSLIIIDTLASIRGRKGKDEDQYQCDYRTMKALFELNHKTGVSIIVIHHVRKATAADIFDTISGTNGFSAVADTLTVLVRENDQLRFSTRGRDAPPEDKVVDFDPEDGTWTVLQDYEPEEQAGGKTSSLIIASLYPKDRPSTPADVAKVTNLPVGTVRQALRRLAKANRIGHLGHGQYYAL